MSPVTDNAGLRELLKRSRHFGTLASWTEARKFIASAIDRPGTILDIGCANGFLLRCLQDWCPNRLIPYGIDIDRSSVSDARNMFPAESDHFVSLSSHHLHKLEIRGLPVAYDFVYWNVGDNVRFNRSDEFEQLCSIINTVKIGGRLILGFYDKDAQVREEKIRKLIQRKFNVQGHVGNASNTKVAIWIER